MNEKFKLSKFNYNLLIEDKHYILNSLTKKIYLISDDIYLEYCKLENIVFQRDEYRYIDKMINAGLIVSEYIDQNIVASSIKNNQIYNSKELFLMIIPTNNCNFKCVYCPQEHEIGIISEKTKESLLKFIQVKSKEFKRINISWFGGEPLLAKKDIIDIMNKLKYQSNINMPIISTITTNGYLLDAETFQNLIRLNVLYYQITLDGMPDRHNSTRPLRDGSCTFDVIMNNLKEIKNTIKSRNFRIVIRMNIDETFLDEIDEFIGLCSKEFKGDTRFVFYPKLITNMGGDRIKKIESHLITSWKVLFDIAKKLQTVGLSTYNDYDNTIQDIQCYSSKNGGFAINFDGEIYKCNTLMSDSESTNIECYYNKLGSLKNGYDYYIDENKLSKWLERSIDNFECRDCSIYPLCLCEICPSLYHFRDRRCMLLSGDADYQIMMAVLNGNYLEL